MAESGRSSRLPTGVVAAVVFLIATAALFLLLRGGDGGSAPSATLFDYDPASFEEDVVRRLDPVQLRPSRTLRVTGRRIEWRDGSGRAFLETPRLSVGVLLGAGASGGVLISDGVVERPRVRLVQTGEGDWNYERALAPLLSEDGGDDGGGGGMAIRLRDITLEEGQVVLELLDARYEARSVDARLAEGMVAGPGVDAPTFSLSTLEAELVLPDSGDGDGVVRAVSAENARLRLVDGALAFEVDRATFGGSRLADARGVWDPARGGLGLDLRATAVEARVADLPWLPGEVPEGASGSFQLRLEPAGEGRTAVTMTDLDLRAPGSSARGSLRAVIGGTRPVLDRVDLRVDPVSLDLVEAFTGPLPYGGAVSGTVEGTGGDIRFDLQGRLTAPGVRDPFDTRLTGRVALTEAGVELHGADVGLDQVPLAALEALVPGLPLRGPVSGTVRLDGAPGEGPLDLDLRLEAGGGIVTVAGTADLSGPVPTYDVTGELIGVELRSVFRPAVPPVEVHADFALAGAGTEPATARATLRAAGTFTGWQSEAGDTLVVAAEVRDGSLDVETLRMEVGPMALAAAGAWNFTEGAGTVRYDLAVSDLAPLGPYLPADREGQRRFARGSLELTGSAGGTLDAPVVEGEVSARGFRWGEWAAETLAGSYDATLGNGLPRIEARLSAEELRSPTADFDAVELDVDFGRPEFDIAFRGDQQGGRGVVEVEAGGRIDETGHREVTLRTLEVDLSEQRWRIAEPADIAWTAGAGERVRIEGLELRQTDGDGRLVVSGIVAPLDALDLSLDVARLPIGDVLELLGSDVELAGELSVEGELAGPANAPSLDVTASLLEGSFRGVAVRSVEADVRYREARLEVEGQGLLGDSARIDLEGTVPARLLLEGGPFFAFVDDGPIDLRVDTRTFPLSTLDPGVESVEDLTGLLEADLRIEGTPAQPRLAGAARVRDAAVTVPLLERRFRNIRGTVELDGREARIRDMVVESDGTATVQGRLAFQELTNPVLDLTVELQRFAVQQPEDESPAGFWGTARLEGTAQNPVLRGSLRADDGAISLAPFRQPELSTRLAGGGRVDLLDPAADLDLGGSEDGGGVRIDELTLEAGDDLWFVTDEARANLSGTLVINKTGSVTTIQGTLRGEQGTFELAAGPINRRFRIVSAELRFFGSPDPNPRLDIVASRAVRIPNGADVDVQVRVVGTLDNPSLNLATASGTDIPESELLSFLLFGRPGSDLAQVTGGTGVEGVLGQSVAYTGLAEVLFSELNEELGVVDYFQIDFLPTGAMYVTAGKEIADDWLLTADVPISTEQDLWAAGLEYQACYGICRLAWEPVERRDRLVGARTLSLFQEDVPPQVIFTWRRRWSY